MVLPTTSRIQLISHLRHQRKSCVKKGNPPSSLISSRLALTLQAPGQTRGAPAGGVSPLRHAALMGNSPPGNPGQGDGSSPCSGKSALRVAMIDRSTRSPGSYPDENGENEAAAPSVMVSGGRAPVRARAKSRQAPGVAAAGSSGRPAASASRWVQVRGTT